MLIRLAPLLLLASACATAEAPPVGPPYVRLATELEAEAALTADDEFFRVLTPADFALRVTANRPRTLEALKAQYRGAVRNPGGSQHARLLRMSRWLSETLAPIRQHFPAEVLIVVVSPEVEGGLPHTRANAIFLPQHAIARMSDTALEELLLHEAFHVLSRHNRLRDPARADSLYAVLGFQPCRAVAVPESIDRQRITNPDAPFNRHYLPLAETSSPATPTLGVIPYLTDAPIGGAGARYYRGRVTLGLLTVAINGGDCRVEAANPTTGLKTFPEQESPLYRRIARNTDYVIHPEEVLADNFVLLTTGKEAEDSALLDRLAAWLGWPQSGSLQTGERP